MIESTILIFKKKMDSKDDVVEKDPPMYPTLPMDVKHGLSNPQGSDYLPIKASGKHPDLIKLFGRNGI